MGYFPVFVLFLFVFLGGWTATLLTVGYGTWLFLIGYLSFFIVCLKIFAKPKDRPSNSSGEAWEHSTITIEEVFKKRYVEN